jgi:23S rRNA pseudouridine1911/1915/1917 synthase
VQKLIGDGNVLVNSHPARSGIKLNNGDLITINSPPNVPTSVMPEAIPVKILYEDDDVLVVDKPPGLAVHPSPGHPTGTLVNALLSHLPALIETGNSRPGIVHRLDKDTSGVMLVAKNTAAHTNLTEQFKSRNVNKTYLVLVKGRLTPQDGVIEAPIGRDTAHRERMAVVAESRGRASRTRYHVKEYLNGYTLLEVKPETGRTHQIRVHVAAIGYPVAGDKVYGVRSTVVPRQFVHACRLGFKLPSTGEYVEFTAELPPDLAEALAKLKTNL